MDNKAIAYSWLWNWFLWFLWAKLLHCVVVLLLIFCHKHFQRFSRLKQVSTTSQYVNILLDHSHYSKANSSHHPVSAGQGSAHFRLHKKYVLWNADICPNAKILNCFPTKNFTEIGQSAAELEPKDDFQFILNFLKKFTFLLHDTVTEFQICCCVPNYQNRVISRWSVAIGL